MGTCCGPWKGRTAACSPDSSSPPARVTAWFTTRRGSSVCSASTANCWPTWRWRTASRWGNVRSCTKMYTGERARTCMSAPHLCREPLRWLKACLWARWRSARLGKNRGLYISFFFHPHPPEEMCLLIRGAVVRSDCGDGGEHSTGVVSPGRRHH